MRIAHEHQRVALSATALRLGCAGAVTMALAGCLATTPTTGNTPNAVSGAAGGATAENTASTLERCGETLGTVAFDEDQRADWYGRLRHYNLPSTVPVLRLMVQQSNCFVVVERGRSMNNMMRERELMRGNEGRAGSNFGGGQMVAADYTIAPEIFFSGRTGGGSAGVAALGSRLFGGSLGWVAGAAAGSIKQNEASTTLLLIDNRSGVQVSAAEGFAKNMDMGIIGSFYGGGAWSGAGAYSQTPEGRVILAAFTDSYNQMVRALRNYKAQTVRGGLGTGGRLGVQGGQTEASREIQQPARPTR